MSLPRSFLLLTAVSGIVDAVSFLKLGHVFVANMTGNVVFVGFGLAGSVDVSVPASLLAIAAFLLGSLAAGRLAVMTRAESESLLRIASGVQFALVAGSAALSAAGAGRYPIIGVLGVAMGLQNATARRIAVPDLTTTVLTMTLTGLAADSMLAGGNGSKARVRLLAVLAMLLGALAGALLVLHLATWVALALAALVLGAVAVTSRPG